jgi:hypothetical protein
LRRAEQRKVSNATRMASISAAAGAWLQRNFFWNRARSAAKGAMMLEWRWAERLPKRKRALSRHA